MWITAQRKISDPEVCQLFADTSVCLINYDNKESGWQLSQKQCSIRTSCRAFSMRQKRILKETRCFRRSHDRGRSQGNFKNGDNSRKRLSLVHVPHNADMYVCDHTSSRVGREGVFAKMNAVAFRINVRIFEVTPKALVIIGSAEALPILCVSDFCERQRERERERERERRLWRHSISRWNREWSCISLPRRRVDPTRRRVLNLSRG